MMWALVVFAGSLGHQPSQAITALHPAQTHPNRASTPSLPYLSPCGAPSSDLGRGRRPGVLRAAEEERPQDARLVGGGRKQRLGREVGVDAGASAVGTLRLRGGMDAAQQHEFEMILSRLQQPDATPQERQQAQQFALLLQNPVDFSEIDPKQLALATDANGRRQMAIQKRLAQLQHILDNSKSPTAQVIACCSRCSPATPITNRKGTRESARARERKCLLTFTQLLCAGHSV